MVKKSKKKGVPRPRQQREATPNMFERLGNKKRFDVLGRKTKGEVRNINKLRSAATEKRKSTLLVEYRQLRKSNAFIDRRFGEDDDTLTADERALFRFQKQRLRELAGSKFTLPDDDGPTGEDAQLTHLGQSLAEIDDIGGGWSSDDDGQMDGELTERLHFGGGFMPSKEKRNIDDEDQDRPKSKKEVMEEIIAKSKMAKAMKSQQREEDMQATEALDEAWKQLQGGGLLSGMLRPKGSKGKDDLKNIPVDENDKKFDVLSRELVFEAKAQPGERTLTAEELAELERHRLEELEKERLKRQRNDDDAIGGDGLEDDFGEDIAPTEDGTGPLGGYAARRAKRARRDAEKANQDSEDDGSDSENSDISSESDSEDEEDDNNLDLRRKARAQGDHPLQEAFRGVAAKLLAKHGLGEPLSDDDSDDDYSEEEDEDSEEEKKESSSESDSEAEQSEEEEEEEEEQPTKDLSASVLTSNGQMTFTPPLPASYQEFSTMVAGLSGEDLGELLRRIRGFNAVALSTEGRKKTQILYGCVVQHYVSLAGAAPPKLDRLDALLPHIMELTAQVPFYSATLARERLKRAQKQLIQCLKDPLLKASAWPSTKTLLLLKLFTIIYPVSDKRHPVLTPASLFVTNALSLCPIARPRDVATGLFMANLAVVLHAGACRLCAEPLKFAIEVLETALLSSGNDAMARWLMLSQKDLASSPGSIDEIENFSMEKIFGDEENEKYFTSAAFKSSAAAAAIKLIGKIINSLQNIDALPEIAQPAVEILKKIVKASAAGATMNGKFSKKSKKQPDTKTSGTVAAGVGILAGKVLSEIDAAVAEIRGHRRPLFSATLAAVPETKQYNPRYEEQYATGKDYDPDRERAERRRLQRELQREERGATRELRRDAAFMAGVRDREKAALQAELDNSARRAMSFLEQQQSDHKSGSQGGHYKKKKKK